MLPSCELSVRGICRPADRGCALPDRGTSRSASRGGTKEESIVPDFRFIAFWIGLCFTLPNGPALLGVATFRRLDFLALAFAASLSDISIPSMSLPGACGSKGDVAFELGAVLGLV